MEWKRVDMQDNIIYEIKNGNGYIKEYENDGPIIAKNVIYFEGEYLNGEKNGKGKEYDSFVRLKFEGEYLNGKRNGQD